MDAESAMDDTMLLAMLIMTLGFWAYSIAVAMSRVRSIILERERSANWVRDPSAEAPDMLENWIWVNMRSMSGARLA